MGVLNRWLLGCLALLSAAFLCACVSQPKLSDLNGEQKLRLSRMLVFKNEGLPSGSYQIIGNLESVACKESFDEKKEVARLKIRAAKLDADAVINLKFEAKDELDWTHDCWSTMVTTGDAVRIKDSGAVAARPGANADSP